MNFIHHFNGNFTVSGFTDDIHTWICAKEVAQTLTE
jgi:hypothetical protein